MQAISSTYSPFIYFNFQEQTYEKNKSNENYRFLLHDWDLNAFYAFHFYSLFHKTDSCKRLGIDNAFTAFVFFDNVNMETADLGGHAEDNSDGYTNVTINWEHQYPFDAESMAHADPILTFTLLPQDNRYVRILNSLEEKVDVYSSICLQVNRTQPNYRIDITT